jgi:hypothetical protein
MVYETSTISGVSIATTSSSPELFFDFGAAGAIMCDAIENSQPA